MTREEIIACYSEAVYGAGLAAAAGNENAMRDYELLKAGFDALRGPTREQVEKMRGEWKWFDEEVTAPFEYQEREWGWRCSKCGVVLPDDFDNPDYTPPMRFCENCGAPMTDEAVDMVMERLEEMQNDQ